MTNPKSQLSLKFLTIVFAAIALSLIAGSRSAWTSVEAVQDDDARAKAAFLSIVPVLRHPRCLNCHSTGDFPRQGDDGHVHAQNVRRGADGRGKFGQKCSACHQEQNVAGFNMPPGAPGWHLPPANMPMIWQGRTPGQICRLLKDPKQNNGK